ncbi:MAG: arginine decarboxylase, pyruvoyl-dependent [Candidatus Aminicenantes bacterium]|nr:arginine decarboxylase, pyruvoyl-dependent [Candidatus Aminicenantes bacterium]MDH5715007.1 arginine decarboxylase, pyruvoyl-dependent [Candidatus Aminicenantes bacterium]
MIPSKVFLTKGVGKHKDKLQSFEHALRKAGIAYCNIVRVSSILPPGCVVISREKGLNLIEPGEIIYCVLSEGSTNEPNRLIVASIGIAIPSEKGQYGYISEHHTFGQTEEVAGDYAEDLAASMLASTLGIEFDLDIAWDERKQVYKMEHKIVRTSNISQSAIGDKNGLWTTAVAAAIFIR